jgi:hypothetical protein
MAKNKNEDVQSLEKGNIYFFFRPRVGEETAKGLQDVERFYMVLEPTEQHEHLYRLLIIGQKTMPEIKPHGRDNKTWGFVEKVSKNPDEIEDELDLKRYKTKTRGEQTREPARPIGEGIYNIIRHEDHTHLAYALNLPRNEGEVQKAFHLENEASYILSVKNPHQPSKIGFHEGEVHYPEDLLKKFGTRKWIAAEPTSLLDYENAQILLVGAEQDVREELGIDLHPQKEEEGLKALLNDLHMEISQHPTEPLLKGQWK